MAKGVTNFSSKTASSFQRFNQKFNNFFKLGDIQKQLLSFASTAAIAGAIVSAVVFSGRSLLDYEKNVASVRGILNDLTDSGFKPFQRQIDLVAKQMQFSAVDVASSFHKIAELNISLAKTPESIAAVSKAAITLSRAANMELEPATDSLVGIMAQFHLSGTDANRVINVLAAGLKYGSASIVDQTEAYKNWGTVAKSANLTIEQSTALVQTLGKYQLKGAEAGTALRGTVIRLQKAHYGYASGVFNVNNALAEANKHYDSLAKARDKDNFLIKLFGIRQITAGRILLQNTGLINQLTQQVTGSNQAFVQAAINTDTVAGSFEKLKAQFVNYVTGNDRAKAGMVQLKDAIKWVTTNLDGLLDGVITAVKWFGIYKGSVWAMTTIWKGYNLYQKIAIALGRTNIEVMEAETLAADGMAVKVDSLALKFGASETAAASFFGELSGFALPGAIAALIGWQGFKGITDHIHDGGFGWDNNNHLNDPYYKNTQAWKEFFKRHSAAALDPTLGHPGYRPMSLKNLNSLIKPDSVLTGPDTTGFPTVHRKPGFNPIWGNGGQYATPAPNVHSNVTLHLVLDDPHHVVKNSRVVGPTGIDVTVSHTHGAR